MKRSIAISILLGLLATANVFGANDDQILADAVKRVSDLEERFTQGKIAPREESYARSVKLRELIREDIHKLPVQLSGEFTNILCILFFNSEPQRGMAYELAHSEIVSRLLRGDRERAAGEWGRRIRELERYSKGE